MTDSESRPSEPVADQQWAIDKTEEIITQKLNPPCSDCTKAMREGDEGDEGDKLRECRHNACAVCLENMNKEEDLEILNQCHHIFHTACVEEVEKRSLMCPTCRNETELSYVVNIGKKSVETRWRKRDAPTLQNDERSSFMDALNYINMLAGNIGYDFSVIGNGAPEDNGGEMIMQATTVRPNGDEQVRRYRRVNGRFELILDPDSPMEAFNAGNADNTLLHPPGRQPLERQPSAGRNPFADPPPLIRQRASINLPGMEPIRPRRVYADPPPQLRPAQVHERDRSPVRSRQDTMTAERIIGEFLSVMYNPSNRHQ